MFPSGRLGAVSPFCLHSGFLGPVLGLLPLFLGPAVWCVCCLFECVWSGSLSPGLCVCACVWRLTVLRGRGLCHLTGETLTALRAPLKDQLKKNGAAATSGGVRTVYKEKKKKVESLATCVPLYDVAANCL